MFYSYDLNEIEKDFVKCKCIDKGYDVKFKKIPRYNLYSGFEIPSNISINYSIEKNRFIKQLKNELLQLKIAEFKEGDK